MNCENDMATTFLRIPKANFSLLLFRGGRTNTVALIQNFKINKTEKMPIDNKISAKQRESRCKLRQYKFYVIGLIPALSDPCHLSPLQTVS